MKFKHYLLMDAAGDANGGGNGSLLTGNGAGGSSAPPQGSQNGQPPANQGGGNPNPGNGGGLPAGNQAPSWRSSLPTELQTDPALQMFNDIPALAKSYIHAQKMVGADKILVPGKHSTEQDWQQVYTKLGLPEKMEDYQIKLAESATIDKEFTDKFRETAYKAGVLPAQAQKLADWFSEVNGKAEAEITRQKEVQIKADLDGLKSEWGVAFQPKVQRAAQVIRESADPELIKYLDDSGLGNDVRLIKLLSGVAEKYMKEDAAVGGTNGMPPALTPSDAMKAANAIMGDLKSPYHDSQHPNHKSAVAEVQSYFEMANPRK